MNQLKKLFIILTVLVLSAGGSKAEERIFKWSYHEDVKSLDPYSMAENFTLGFLGNVYEALTRNDENLVVQPSLAEFWENTAPTKWIFHLRKGVKFQNGNSFNADDVIFSWQRANSKNSTMKNYAQLISDIKKIDDFTIELTTPDPNPILPREIVLLYIMDKEWSEVHNASEVTNVNGGDEGNYVNLYANGTGPFAVVERQKDVRTVFQRYDGYWRPIDTNITTSIFVPIQQAATRVAALISGQVDLVFPIPLQDWKLFDKTDGVSALSKPGLRTVFLGMDQGSESITLSNVKGKNPLRDQRVRAALAHGINLEAINQKVMRGTATPAGQMVAPLVNGFTPSLNEPYAYDPEKSKRLLRDAGYPDGLSITLDCHNNPNDEKVANAIAVMLAKIDIKVEVLVQPKSMYFAKILAKDESKTHFYMLGWSPSSSDAHNILKSLLTCQNKQNNAGLFNLGNYCNTRIDDLTYAIGIETDQQKRQAMIAEAFAIVKAEYGYLPLLQEPISWGVNDNIRVKQRADNVLDLRDVVVQ